MANGADEGRFAAVGRPGNDLGVEYPQVLPASAAARYNDLVHQPAFVQPGNGIGDLLCRFKALHIHRSQQQTHCGPAPTDDIADILQCSTSLAGNKADTLREPGQRLFVFRCKQSFFVQFCLQLFKGQLCRADAVRKHVVDINLKRAVPLVEGHTAAHHHLHTLFGLETQPPRIGAEHHSPDAGGFVPQGKVAVPAPGVLHKVGNLAPQGQIEQNIIHVQQILDIPVQGRD